MDITERASSIGSLADDTRRELYEFVVAQADAVTRDAAAAAIGIAAHMARFHLDKLVEAGLLDTEFRRLSARTGPGAGRPSKLYRRAQGTIAVSLPERRYDLVGHLFARAIERAAVGSDLNATVVEVAQDEGRQIAAASRPEATADELTRISTVLDAHGYEPHAEGDAIVLANCPFESLARDHTALVCSANLALVGGILNGLQCTHLRASGEPHDGRCCVAIRQAD